MLQVVGELPVQERLRPLLSLPRLLSPLLLVFPPTSPLRDGLDTSSPLLVVIFSIGVVLRPVSPALPHLEAGVGDGAS